MFTGISMLAWIVPWIIGILVGARFSFIFTSPWYFAEESVTGAAQKIARVCSGFSNSEILAPPPPRGVYVVGTSVDLSSQAVVHAINLGRLIGGIASMAYDIRGDFAHHLDEAAKGEVKDAAKGFKKTAKDIQEEVAKLPEEAQNAKEVKELLEASKRIEKNADELETVSDLERRQELLEEIQRDVNKIDRILGDAEAGRNLNRLGGVVSELGDLDKLSDAEKIRLVEKLDKSLSRHAEDLSDLKKEISYYEKWGESATFSDLRMFIEESLEELNNRRKNLEDLVALEARSRIVLSLSSKSLEAVKDASRKAEFVRGILKDVAEGKKYFLSAKYVKEMAKFTVQSSARAYLVSEKTASLLTYMIVLPPFDTVETWSLGIYDKTPLYWNLLLNLEGYAYYYAPDVYIFVNSTDPVFAEISNNSLRISGEINKIQREFVQALIDMSDDAGFYDLKETLMSNPDFSTVLVYGDDGKYHFSPFYKALLLSNYLSETCNFCDCYTHSDQAGRIAALIEPALYGEDIDPDGIPVIKGCELKGNAVKAILKKSEEYENRATDLLKQFESDVMTRTREKLSSCPSFTTNIGGTEYRVSECAVIIDCASSPDRCYLGMPIVSGNGMYIPVDTLSKEDVSSFTGFLGKYYSPSARVSEGGVPSPTGILICTRVETTKACRVVECGKPITYKVTPDIRARVFYDPEEDKVVIEGNVMPWGG